MFPGDYPLLNRPNLVALLLRAAADGPAGLDDCVERLRAAFAAAREPVPLPEAELTARFAGLHTDLSAAGLLEDAGAGRFTLTARGRTLLAGHPDGFDTDRLMVYPEFKAYIRARNRSLARADARAGAFDEGFIAAQTGARLTENPYTPNTVDHQSWENGWAEARDEGIG
ncbi:hypothetical protein GE300_00280 [Rhodobacteraceae bacterium 2CG4]|uniref:Mrr restriction endonuclease-like protein n=1 Tax=Halovulum marinum TaxID=2662447 RepID=A0A6L5YVV8_9RHOB|nr:hypothetical protein [Halovulum marinum]MSU88049.1 hypothetical protein [Halovulum marinum]